MKKRMYVFLILTVALGPTLSGTEGVGGILATEAGMNIEEQGPGIPI